MAGAINTIAGPLIFLGVDFLIFQNVLYSFLLTEAIMLIYKLFVYRTYVFRGHKKRIGFMSALLVTSWGVSTNMIIQSIDLSQGHRRMLSIAVGVGGATAIVIGSAVFSNRISRKPSTGINTRA